MTATQRKRGAVLSVFEAIFSRPHPSRLARVASTVGGLVEEADGIDEMIAEDDADAVLNPSALNEDVPQSEADEKDADADASVAPCSLAARVQRKCARCRNSWPVDQLMDSIFAAPDARLFYCSTVSDKCAARKSKR